VSVTVPAWTGVWTGVNDAATRGTLGLPRSECRATKTND
jgi:hypothetical protein